MGSIEGGKPRYCVTELLYTDGDQLYGPSIYSILLSLFPCIRLNNYFKGLVKRSGFSMLCLLIYSGQCLYIKTNIKEASVH